MGINPFRLSTFYALLIVKQYTGSDLIVAIVFFSHASNSVPINTTAFGENI